MEIHHLGGATPISSSGHAPIRSASGNAQNAGPGLGFGCVAFFLSAGLVLWTTHLGLGLSPDSANYVAATRSLAEEGRLLTATGEPLTLWPPAYPLLLSLFHLVGIDCLVAARALQSAMFGLLVIVSFLLARACALSGFESLLLALLVMFSKPLLMVASWLWTDLPYSLISALTLLHLCRLLDAARGSDRQRQDTRRIILVTSLCSLAVMTRYQALALLVCSGFTVAVLRSHVSKRNRVRDALIILGGSLLPLGAWVLRNQRISGTLTGPRPPGGDPIVEVLSQMFDIFVGWFLPDSSFNPLIRKVYLVGLAILGLFLLRDTVRWIQARRWRTGFPPPHRLWTVVMAFLGSNLALIAAHVTFFGWGEPLTERLFAPLYVPTVLLLTRYARHLGESFPSIPLRHVARVVFIAVLVLLTRTTLQRTKAASAKGQGYNAVTFLSSPFWIFMRTQKQEGRLFSNFPHAMYIATGRYVQTTGTSPNYPRSLYRDPSVGPGDLVALYYYNDTYRTIGLDPIQRCFEAGSVASFPDGELFRLKSRNRCGSGEF